VFQEELEKKFPEHQLKKADVKKHLKKGTGVLIPAEQLLFEQSTLYSIKSKKKWNSKSAGYAESRNKHPPKYLARYYKNRTEAQTEILKKSDRVFLCTALDISEEMNINDNKKYKLLQIN
jgi:hypothetical protein